MYANEENTESSLLEASVVENYPGFPVGITGFSLLSKMSEQAERCGVRIHSEGIAKVLTNEKQVVDTCGNLCAYDAYVEAIGCKPRKFECDGIHNIPVHTCAICDGSIYNGRNVVVIGGGDTAVSSALYLSNIASKVFVLVRKSYCRCTNRFALNAIVEKPNVEIMYETTLGRVTLDDNGKTILHLQQKDNYSDVMLINVDAIFPCIGYDANVVEHIGDGKVWYCGDCVDAYKQVAIAVGSGARVALEIIGETK